MRSAATTPSASRSRRKASTTVMPRFKRGIQYAAASRSKTNVSGILGCPERRQVYVVCARQTTMPGNDMRRNLKLTSLGQFDFDAELDLGQHRIEAGIAGGRLQVGGGIAQPVDGRGIEVAREQPELEIVEHVERAPAPRHRTLAALGWILDALHREQRIDAAGGLRGRGSARLLGGCRRLRRRKAGRAGSPLP